MDLAIQLEDFDKSIKYGEELIEKDKKNIEAYQQTAWSYIRIKQFQKAIDKCVKAIEYEQYSPKNHYLKALAFDSLKRHAEANIEYVIAIKLLKNYELDEKKRVKGQYKNPTFLTTLFACTI
jgi:tetratricopeptide (TPR) repeat protein